MKISNIRWVRRICWLLFAALCIFHIWDDGRNVECIRKLQQTGFSEKQISESVHWHCGVLNALMLVVLGTVIVLGVAETRLKKMTYGRRFLRLLFALKTFIFTSPKHYGPIIICGTNSFIFRITNALELLKEKCPKSHELVLRNLKWVIQGLDCIASVKKPKAFTVSNAVSNEPVNILAADIANVAFHYELYSRGKECSGEKAEQECVDYQIAVLKALGTDEETISWYQNDVIKTRWWEH